MNRLLILAFLLTIPSDDFSVEELTSIEVQKLDAATKKVEKAQAELNAVESEVKANHHQTTLYWGNVVLCDHEWTTVELRGKYALITKHSAISCVIPAGGNRP